MRNSEYRVAWHDWAGIPNPLFSPFVGKHISSRSTRGGGTHNRTVGAHGDNLGAVTGRHMIAKHDEIKWALFGIMRRAGYRAECEVTGLFREFAQNMPESASMRLRDILVPQSTLGPPGSTKNTAVKPGRLTGNGTTRHKTPSAPSNHASTNLALSSPSSSATSVRPTRLSTHF